MDKALDSTAKALANLGHGGKDQGPSKGFQTLIKLIGESKTKHEEDRIIKKESLFLKDRVGGRDVSPRQMREYLIRLIYCEMLGVECSWGYIHAVKMTQSNNLMDKRIGFNVQLEDLTTLVGGGRQQPPVFRSYHLLGYLAVSLFLHENHELNMLLVNTLQRDLKSSNMLEVSMALIIICKLIGSEMIPPLLPLVQDKLLHPKELVRKKAVMVMYHFHKLSPSSVSHLEDDFRRALSDQDPGVMEASLVLIHNLAMDDPLRYKDLAPSFTSILSQIVARKLPSDFDYHGVPAPWAQIRLLRILAVLGADDLRTSEIFYPVVEEVLGSAECTSNIGQAISYECIRTITTIYPNNQLIEKAAHSVVRFVTAPNNNWKYLGINALGSLVKINPKFAAEHQMVVIDCLDDPDETLKRKTLDLLFQMTNQSNVTVIADRLISYLRQTNNEYVRSDLVAKITQLAERFAPDNQWFIQTMNAVFELGGSLVRREMAHNLMRLIAEGTDDEDTDAELRLDAVSSYLDLLEKPHLPDILVKIICWVIGEYSYIDSDIEREDILEKITTLLNRRFEEPDTHGWVVTAITKLVSQIGHLPESVQSQLALYLTSTDTDIQQRCSELVELSQDMSQMQSVLPLDASCEDLEIDSSLSFLDGFVSEALAKGASAYRPPHLRTPTKVKPSASPTGPLKFEAYATPTTSSYPAYPTTGSSSPSLPHPKQDTSPSPRGDTPLSSATPLSPSVLVPEVSSTVEPVVERGGSSYVTGAESSPQLGLAVKERKWGRGGYNKTTPTLAEATPIADVPKAEEHIDSGNQEERGRETTPIIALSTVQASSQPQSRVDKKRSQLASQLFGGLSGPSRAPRAKKAIAGGEPKIGGMVNKPRMQERQQKKSKEPEVDLLLDLQDIDFSQPATPAPSTQEQQPPSGGLLSDLHIHSPSTTNDTVDLLGTLAPQVPSDKPPPSTAHAQNLLDTPTLQTSSSSFITSQTGSGTSQMSLEPPPPTTTSLLDDLSILDSAGLNASGPSDGLALSLYEGPVKSVGVPSELAQFPVVPGWENKDICRDAILRVSVTKILKPDQLVVVLFLTNQKQAEVSGVALSVEKPSNTRATTLAGGADLSLNTNIAGFGTVTQVITLVPTSPAINMNLSGQIIYTDSLATQRRLFFDASLYVTDMIRPCQISTAEFGKKWGSFTHEKKLKMQHSSIKKPPEFMTAMKEKLNFHPVEIIGAEGICAGVFLPSTQCLVHGKIRKSDFEVWVKTPSSLLTESLAKIAQSVFKD